jgi:hypothetical protein
MMMGIERPNLNCNQSRDTSESLIIQKPNPATTRCSRVLSHRLPRQFPKGHSSPQFHINYPPLRHTNPLDIAKQRPTMAPSSLLWTRSPQMLQSTQHQSMTLHHTHPSHFEEGYSYTWHNFDITLVPLELDNSIQMGHPAS